MSNSNNTAARVSVEDFINEVKNAVVFTVENDLITTDNANMQYRTFHNEMKVCGVELDYYGEGSDVTNIENLNVVDESGKRLSKDEIMSILYDHSDIMDEPENELVANFSQFNEEDYEKIDIVYDQHNGHVVGLLNRENDDLAQNVISWGGVREPKSGLCDIEYFGEKQNVYLENDPQKAFELEAEDPQIQRFEVYKGVIVTQEFRDEVREKEQRVADARARAHKAAAGAAPVSTSPAVGAAETPTAAPKM